MPATCAISATSPGSSARLRLRAEIANELGKLNVHGDIRGTLERTVEHLHENQVDVEQTQLTLGTLLHLDPDREAFVDQPQADALLPANTAGRLSYRPNRRFESQSWLSVFDARVLSIGDVSTAA